jgi:hypothetical protein
MRERVVGYALLSLGILVMAVSIYFVYLLLSNHLKPFDVFQGSLMPAAKQQSVSLQDLMSNPSALTQMQSQLISQIFEKQINKTMNLGATIFLMYFIMLFGFRLSTLGVQLIRPIQVKLKTATEEAGSFNVPPKPPKEG